MRATLSVAPPAIRARPYRERHQLRFVVERFTARLIEENPKLRDHLGLVKFTLRNKLREFIETETDRLAELAFDRLFQSGRLCFYLDASIAVFRFRRASSCDQPGGLSTRIIRRCNGRCLSGTPSPSSMNMSGRLRCTCLTRRTDLASAQTRLFRSRASVWSAATCRRCLPRAQANSLRIRPCREQKRQQVGALQTLLRPKTRTFTPYVSCPQCAKPHTGEKVNPSLRGVQSIPAGFAPREARCSLSPREKVRLRGNGANYSLEYRTISGTVELGAGGFAK